MQMTKQEYDELMAHFYFLHDKVEECYKRETEAVIDRLEKEYSKYIVKYGRR